MKIIAWNGSPRGARSQTRRLLDALLEGAAGAGAEVERVDVCGRDIAPCDGCQACYRSGTCIHDDEFPGLLEAALAADGLVFASPNYFRSVTAQLKTAVDRMSDAVHRQLFRGKYGVAVGTAGGPGWPEVTDYMTGLLVNFGAYSVGAVGVSQSDGPAGMEGAASRAVSLGKELAEAIRTRRAYPEQQAVHEKMAAYFRTLVEMNKDRWEFEYAYWSGRRG